ncbi:MAG: S9 family peptidase [Armatimonadota bacterium]|nr:S9 family peptidase [Armatimonadota bacterium]
MPKRPLKPEDLLRVAVPSDPRLSPDGDSAVYVVKRVAEKNKYASNLYLWRGGGVQRLTAGDSNDSQPRWKPDGTSIAFTSDRQKPKPGLFELPLSGGESRCLVDLPEGSLGKYEWSPDGNHIAFLFRKKSADRTEDAKKSRVESGLSDPPLVVESLTWRMDGDGVFGDDRFELCVLDVVSGAWSAVASEAKDGEYAFCWIDADHLAVAYNPSDNPTMEPWLDDIHVVGLDGDRRVVEGIPVGPKGSLTSLGNGEIAVVFSDRGTDRFGYKVGRLCYLNIESGEWSDPWKDRTDLDLNVWTLGDIKEPGYGARLSVPTNGGRLCGDLSREGSTHVYEFNRDGSFIPLTSGLGEWSLGTVSETRIAVTRISPTSLPEIAIIEDGKVIYCSTHNTELSEEVELLPGEEAWVESEPGVKVQTWIMKPYGFQEWRKYPACLEVHGGPHGMYSCCVFLEMQVLAGAGYVVAWSNPRGSTGYGEEFARCITGDWGNKDWTDIQAVTKFLADREFVDANRIAIMGGSYGGYMVNWAIGHSDAFKCAITDRCVANLLSKSGNSDYTFVPDGNWPGSAFAGDWETLWDRSPVKHFKNVTTPTLVVHSEGDLRCHVEQGEQVYTFLKMKGVPTRFVRYPVSTSHGMSRSGPPDLRIHRLREQLDWYAKHL